VEGYFSKEMIAAACTPILIRFRQCLICLIADIDSGGDPALCDLRIRFGLVSEPLPLSLAARSMNGLQAIANPGQPATTFVRQRSPPVGFAGFIS
jgi:hypothetical protein